MIKYTVILSLFLLFNFHGQLTAQELNNSGSSSKNDRDGFSPGWAIGIKASTLGFGLELTKSFSKSFNLRLGGSYFKYDILSFFPEEDDIEYANATVGSISLIADWHFLSFMHFSGGLLYNMTNADINEIVKEAPSTGGPPVYVGTINYVLTPNEICPYLGIGFGRSIAKQKVVSFNFDLGIVYQGTPKLNMTSTGDVSQEYFDSQKEMFKDSMNNYKFFPFVNLQLSFRFL